MKRLFFAAIVPWLLLTGCTSAAASAPAALQSPTSVVTSVPIRPSTATPLPLGRRPVYVVDPRDGNLTGQVLVVDAEAQRVMRSFPTRYAPEIAISSFEKSFSILDTADFREIATMRDLGDTPAQVVVPFTSR